jgi:hypothetical protein
MNPHYHWMTESLELLTFFVIGPALGLVIAYKAWRHREDISPKQSGIRCIASGGTALLLFGFAKWIDADIRTPQYFLQLACVLLCFLLFGVCQGYFFSVLIGAWRWHNTTRLN